MVPEFSTSFQLMAAACRWPPSASRDDAVRAAAQKVTDWQDFLAHVEDHRVSGLVQAALTAAGVALPSDIAHTLAQKAKGVSYRGLQQLAETIRLQRLLQNNGIRAFALKGVVIGQKAFGTVGLKTSFDIDFYMAEGDVLAALGLLQQDGYCLSKPADGIDSNQISAMVRYGREMLLYHPQRKMFVELQWQLVSIRAVLPRKIIDWEGQSIAFSGDASVRTFTDGDLFSYVCAHGATHAWVRLKWLADVNAWLNTLSREEWVQFYGHSRALGLGACFTSVLLLCETIFETPIPPGLRAQLRVGWQAKGLVNRALRALQLPPRAPSGLLTRLLNSMADMSLVGHGPRFWASFIYSYCVSTSMIEHVSIAPPWQWIYPFSQPFFWLWYRWINPKSRYGALAKNGGSHLAR